MDSILDAKVRMMKSPTCCRCGSLLEMNYNSFEYYPCKKCSEEEVKETIQKLKEEIESIKKDKERTEILYSLARLVRNTDCIHISKKGEMYGQLLVRLRNLDGEMYDRLVISKEMEMK